MLPKGLWFTRRALAIAASNSPRDAAVYAAGRWGVDSPAAQELRALATGDDALIGTAATSDGEFVELAGEMSLLGRMKGVRRIPRGVPVAASASGCTGFWVGEGRPVPVSRAAFSAVGMFPLRAGALLVVSNEVLREPNPLTEAVLRRDLLRAASAAVDRALVDETATIAGTTPDAVTAGITPIASSGDVAEDAEAALSAYTADVTSAAWIMAPRTAAAAGLRALGRGVAADLGATGGQLAGLPVFTTSQMPVDSDGGSLVILLDQAALAAVDDGVTVRRSEGAVEIADADEVSGDTLAPTGAGQVVSLFQSDCVGLLLLRFVNWKLARTGAAVVIAGATYGMSSS